MAKTTKKKTVKKKTAKRTTRKRTAKKTTASKKLDKIAKNHHFVRSDGVAIGSLLELARQLDDMAEDVFYHHVTSDRNDFAQWVGDIFKDSELAEAIKSTSNKHHTTYIVMRHIVNKL